MKNLIPQRSSQRSTIVSEAFVCLKGCYFIIIPSTNRAQTLKNKSEVPEKLVNEVGSVCLLQLGFFYRLCQCLLRFLSSFPPLVLITSHAAFTSLPGGLGLVKPTSPSLLHPAIFSDKIASFSACWFGFACLFRLAAGPKPGK